MSPVERRSAPTDIQTCAEEEAGLEESIEIHNLELLVFDVSNYVNIYSAKKLPFSAVMRVKTPGAPSYL